MAYRIFRAEEIGSYGRADNRDAITRIQVSLTDEGARCNNKRPDIKIFRGDAIDGSVPVFIAVDDLVGTVYSRRHIIAIMMITAATPIMMPSIVKTERSLLEQSAVKAMEILSLNNIHDHPFAGVLRNYTVTQQQLSARTGGDFRFVRDENDRFLFLM